LVPDRAGSFAKGSRRFIDMGTIPGRYSSDNDLGRIFSEDFRDADVAKYMPIF